MARLAATVVLVVFVAASLHADVTITSAISGKGMGMREGGESRTYIKGSKMRMEQGDQVSVLDAATRQMIVLNPKRQEAEVYDMAKLAADIEKNLGGAPRTSMTPTGQSKTILGRSCTEYTMIVSVPMQMGNDSVTMTMSGPVWVAEGAPGTEEYATFYRTAAENGLFFGNPALAKAQGGQLKSQTEMYRALAELKGVPYQIDLSMKFEGGGMLGAMMGKMGGFSTSTVVTAVSTDPVGDDLFVIPPGYKTRNR